MTKQEPKLHMRAAPMKDSSVAWLSETPAQRSILVRLGKQQFDYDAALWYGRDLRLRPRPGRQATV